MRNAFADIIKLSKSGIIPKEIPSHYVRFCLIEHKRAKGLKVPLLGWNEIPPNVIILAS